MSSQSNNGNGELDGVTPVLTKPKYVNKKPFLVKVYFSRWKGTPWSEQGWSWVNKYHKLSVAESIFEKYTVGRERYQKVELIEQVGKNEYNVLKTHEAPAEEPKQSEDKYNQGYHLEVFAGRDKWTREEKFERLCSHRDLKSAETNMECVIEDHPELRLQLVDGYAKPSKVIRTYNHHEK